MPRSKPDEDLVFSTDRTVASQTHQPVQDVVPAQTTLRVRLEKAGRKGKPVTVVFDLPHNPPYFQALVKRIKAACGAGGAYKDDTMEVQGDRRQQVKTLLEAEGFNVKLAGG